MNINSGLTYREIYDETGDLETDVSEILDSSNISEKFVFDQDSTLKGLKYRSFIIVAGIIAGIALTIIVAIGVISLAILIAPSIGIGFVGGLLLIGSVVGPLGTLAAIVLNILGSLLIHYVVNKHFFANEARKLEVLNLNFVQEVNFDVDIEICDFTKIMHIYYDDKILGYMRKMSLKQLSELRRELGDEKFRKYIDEYSQSSSGYVQNLEKCKFILDLDLNDCEKTNEKFTDKIYQDIQKDSDLEAEIRRLFKGNKNYEDIIDTINSLSNANLLISNDQVAPSIELVFKDQNKMTIKFEIFKKFEAYIKIIQDEDQKKKCSIKLCDYKIETFQFLLKILDNQSLKINWEQAYEITQLAEHLNCEKVIGVMDTYLFTKMDQIMRDLYDKTSNSYDFLFELKESQIFQIISVHHNLPEARKKFISSLIHRLTCHKKDWTVENFKIYYEIIEQLKKESSSQNIKDLNDLSKDFQDRLKNIDSISFDQIRIIRLMLNEEGYQHILKRLVMGIELYPDNFRELYEQVASQDEKFKSKLLDIVKNSKDKKKYTDGWKFYELPEEINAILINK